MFTPVKRAPNNPINEMAFQTPLSFTRELRQVLQERNLLTAKSRKKVCELLTDSPVTTPNTEMNKRKNFRLQAVQEIINSEKTYLGQLEMLMQYFVHPLKERGIIGYARHTALFGQIEMIYNLNGELLRELESNMDNVADAFLKMAPFLKLYSVYAFDYKSSLLILQEMISKNPVFRKFLEQTESRPEVQRKLNSLMIVPIQRVPRYKLLLEQVLLYTSPADADFKLLKEAVKQVESIASHINSCCEDQEVTQMLINLQNSLVNHKPNIVKPSRKVIKEGVLHKITRNGTQIKRYCVLMSDIFMYCKILKERAPNTVVENSLECCCIFPLKKSKVHELFPGNFKVTCQSDGIIFGTTDLQLGRIWVGFIRDAIDLHVQCRQTLRKESSKRTPIRRKGMKNFDSDYVLSPNKKKCDYEFVFRNKNGSTDSEDERDSEEGTNTCFKRKSKKIYVSMVSGLQDTTRKAVKRPAVPPPPPPQLCDVEMRAAENKQPDTETRFSKLYKLISNDKVSTRGILKPSSAATLTATQKTTSGDADPSYGFANRYSDSKSYFRAQNIDTMPTAVKREDLFGNDLGDGNFRDQLFPLRSSGGSNKSGDGSTAGWSTPARRLVNIEKENEVCVIPPQKKKRVKFNDTKHSLYNNIEGLDIQAAAQENQAFKFSHELIAAGKSSLREKIKGFFANLF